MVEGSGTWFDYRPTDRASTSRPAAETRDAIIESHARLRGPVDRTLYPKRFRTTARQSQFLGIPNRHCPPSLARGRRPGAIGFPIGNALLSDRPVAACHDANVRQEGASMRAAILGAARPLFESRLPSESGREASKDSA